jgi:hypothetical protein
MKKQLEEPIEVSIYVDVNDNDLQDIEIKGLFCYEDEGIGSYEYWGSRETHSDWQWVLNDTLWDKDGFTHSENEAIQKYIDESDTLVKELEFKLHQQINNAKIVRPKYHLNIENKK